VKRTGCPLHPPFSPSLPLTCVTVCHHISTGIYNVILRRFRATIASVEKKLTLHNFTVCFVVTGILHAMRMRHIFVCGRPVYYIFQYYLMKARFSGEKILIEHKTCVLICLQSLSETDFILRSTKRHVIKNVYWYSCKVPIILVRFS